MSPGELIGSIAAGMALILPAIKWLISDWAKKAKEIEKLKALHTTSALNRFEEDIKNFRTSVDSIQATIRELNAALLQNKSDVATLKERFDDMKKSLDHYYSNFNNQIKNLIKTEIVELSKRASLLRDKKNGAE